MEISLREREEEVGGKREGQVGGEGKREERAREQREGGGDVIVLRFAVIVIPVRKSCCSNCTDTD